MNADRAHAFSRIADDPQNLYPALAFRARALLEAGRRAEGAQNVEELLAALATTPSLPSFWSWTSPSRSSGWAVGRSSRRR